MKGAVRLLLGTAMMVLACASLMFSKPRHDASMKRPSIEGTYKLVSRTLPDGKTITPPNVMGLQTFTKNYRNFNVVWVDDKGKHFSYSVASTYKLSATTYTETILFSIMNDEIGGKAISYSLKEETKSVPIKLSGQSIAIRLPFDPPSVVFEGSKLTATAEGMFTDYWEKVK